MLDNVNNSSVHQAEIAAVQRDVDLADRPQNPVKEMAQDGLQGGVRRSPINAPSNPLPRARVLWTNSKNPKYSGKVSCGIPRWGRSHDRSSDQNPSRVLT